MKKTEFFHVHDLEKDKCVVKIGMDDPVTPLSADREHKSKEIIDKPFNHEFRLPLNIHSWMILEPYYIPLWRPPGSPIVMIMNSIAQVFIIYILHNIITKKNDPVCPDSTNIYFLFMAITILVMRSVNEFFEGIYFCIYLTTFKYQNKRERFRFNEKEEIVTGITKGWMYLYILIGLIPKFGIAILHLVISASYIMISPDDETLFLNMLSVFFILEIDDWAFQVFSNPYMNKFIEDMPPISELTLKDPTMRKLFKYTQEDIKIVIAGATVFLIFCLGCLQHKLLF